VYEISSTALHDLHEIQSHTQDQPTDQDKKDKDELKEYLNQFKKK
jgi:hypothetical protein